ncbi:unnamed protein product [Schistocephalus solidus]|uniref:Uncharacterized protein n=1 Tax=Schistocephalus solidus TaxID=70667 RepID=A0A183T2A5_SCHSO|nr:unnamed protein product [Schistocephalus solidus]
MWKWAHWLTDRRTRLHVPQYDLAPITHTPGFTYPGDMEEPSPSDSESTGQPLDTNSTYTGPTAWSGVSVRLADFPAKEHIHWADGVVWCKRQIGSLPSHGFYDTVILSGAL